MSKQTNRRDGSLSLPGRIQMIQDRDGCSYLDALERVDPKYKQSYAAGIPIPSTDPDDELDRFAALVKDTMFNASCGFKHAIEHLIRNDYFNRKVSKKEIATIRAKVYFRMNDEQLEMVRGFPG